MNDNKVFANYEHYQIELSLKIDLNLKDGNKSFYTAGYSELSPCCDYLNISHPGRVTLIRNQIKDSVFSAFRKFDLIENGIKEGSKVLINNSVFHIAAVNVVSRAFFNISIVEKTHLTKSIFREYYTAYKNIYGRDFKSKIAQKFNIKTRSVENYLQGRLPKTKTFYESVKLMRSLDDLPDKYKFILKNNPDLDSSMYGDKSGLLRTKIYMREQSIIYSWVWSDFFDNISAMVSTAIKTGAMQWLIDL